MWLGTTGPWCHSICPCAPVSVAPLLPDQCGHAAVLVVLEEPLRLVHAAADRPGRATRGEYAGHAGLHVHACSWRKWRLPEWHTLSSILVLVPW
jgi:hypothetical protein